MTVKLFIRHHTVRMFRQAAFLWEKYVKVRIID